MIKNGSLSRRTILQICLHNRGGGFMRYVQGAAIAIVLLALSPSPTLGQSGISNLSIPPNNSSYQLVSSTRFSLTQFYYTYRPVLSNSGPAVTGVTGTVTSLAPGVLVVAGQGTVHFDPVPANGQVTSTDTFTILVNRTVAFTFNDLQWSFQNPFADPGPNQTVPLNTPVTLNAGGSTNPGGIGPLTYSWTFQSVPSGSAATLTNASAMVATFVPDVSGTYTVLLTVNNGVQGDSAVVAISTENSPPVANAGPNQTAAAGTTVQLNGGGSSDVDGRPLTYTWNFVSLPPGSAATLTNPSSVTPSFVADVAGAFIVQLIVNDGLRNSQPSTVTVTTGNTPPVANAGSNQQVNVNSLVQLHGSGSTDVNGNPLTYVWTLNTTQAPGSKAVLSNPTSVNPTFTADVPGTYVAQLIVNDGFSSSQPATVTISTNAVQAPTANAGVPQTVAPGTTVTLNGAGSTDPQGLPLTYSWSLITRPTGSNASLSASNIVNPTFVADQPGTYVAQLTVNNGFLSSITPATVTIATASTPPVANAGPNQTVPVGGTAFLNGSQSSDPNNQPLTYSWAFLSVPTGSNATLNGPTMVNPSFVADLPGTYVVQLIVHDPSLSSNPATVTITAGTFTITLAPNPLNLTSAPGTLTLTLNPPVGASPVSVSLSGFDPTVISVPTPVTVPANASGANVTVTPLASGTTGVIAHASGYTSGNALVTVVLPSVSIAFNNNATAVGLTHSLSGTVTLSAPAPQGGTTIALSSSPVGSVSFNPAGVTISQGGSSGTFSLTGAAAGPTTITASAPGVTSGTADILVVSLGGIGLPAGVIAPVGQSVTFNISLQNPAPPDGATVTLASSDPGTLTVSPTSVVIAPGARSPSVQPQVTGVAVGSATITASAGGYTGNSVTVNVTGSISLSPQNLGVAVGGQQNLTVTLSSAAPAGGVQVNLSSSNTSAATVPASVNVTGQSATVPVAGVAPGSATITASTSNPLFTVTGTGVAVTVTAGLAITCPTNTTGTQGVAFSTGLLTLVGGTGPFTFAIVGTLPMGLSLNTSNGTVSGIPTAAGTFSVKVTDSTNATATSCAFTINGPIAITCPANTTGTQGVSFSIPALSVTGGTTPLTFSIVGTLPTGLTLNTTSGAVSGVPSAAGTFSIKATDAHGAVATSCPFTINGPISITCPTTTTGTQGVPFSISALTVAGGTAPLTFSIVGTLPAGLSLNTGTGAVSGTPSATGSFTIKVTDAQGATATSCAFTINGPISITCPTTTTGTQGVPFSSPALVVGGGTGPYTFSIVGTLPAGLSLNTGNGAISGTPGAAGSFNVKVTDASGATATSCAFNITGTISITCPTNTMGTQGASFNSPALTVTGGTAPFTFSIVGTLPAGLSLNTGNGAISGIPTATGSFTVKATDAQGVTATSCLFTINGPISITCPANTTGTQGVFFSSPALVVGGGTAPYTFSIVGGAQGLLDRRIRGQIQRRSSAQLPAGLILNTVTGAVSGTPSASGTFTIQVTDANGAVASSCVFTINAAPSITCPANTMGTQGVSFNTGALTVTGGTKPLTFSIVGTLPAGLSLNAGDGTVSGIPTAAGSFTVKVTDAQGATATSCPFTINGPISITCPTTTTGTQGVSFNTGPLTVVGGTGSLTFSIVGGLTNLPAGLTLSTTTGAVTGIATATGSFTVKVTDATGATATSCPFTINPAAGLTVTCSTTTTGVQGTVFNSGPIVVTGGTTPYTFSIVGGLTNLPAGLSLSTSTGAVSGAPSVSGTFSIQVKDVNNLTGTTCAITIQPTLAITTTSLPQGALGVAYSFQPQVAGGTSPFVWSFSGLPTGLSGNTVSGLISGIPRSLGTSMVTISVFDSTKPTGQSFTTQPLSLTIAQGTLSLSTNPSPLLDAKIGVAYSAQIVASGGLPPYNYSVNTTSPTFPAWLTFDVSGSTCNTAGPSVCGTPTSAFIGTNTFTATVIDSANTTVNQTFSFMVTQQSGTGALVVQSVTVGQGLQVPMMITFNPAPTFGVTDPVHGCDNPTTPGCLTVSSSNAAVMIQGHGGSSTQVVVPVAAGTTSLSLLVQAVGSPGATSTITASAAGYTNGTATTTIAKSGFVLSGPNSIGGDFTNLPGCLHYSHRLCGAARCK